jgi:molybdenum cofactor biosynthesis enzyme MoaA
LTRLNDVEVRFIEFMPFDSNRWKETKMLSYADMVNRIQIKYPSFTKLPPESIHETSKTWHVPGYVGRVGFISSMSDHFCSTCNRLRLTADGSLKVCLFGPQEVSLRDAIREGRNDEELALIVGAAVQKKKSQHAGMMQIAAQKNRPMITIGG